jgi:hypothetical protein
MITHDTLTDAIGRINRLAVNLRENTPETSAEFDAIVALLGAVDKGIERLNTAAYDKDGIEWRTVSGWWSAKYDSAERQIRENFERAERAEAALEGILEVSPWYEDNNCRTYCEHCHNLDEERKRHAPDCKWAAASALIDSLVE